MKDKRIYLAILPLLTALLLLTGSFTGCSHQEASVSVSDLKEGFVNPPDTTWPGVYWYFMDGNLSKEGMTKDLESMKQSGINSVIFLEVSVGVPRGKVDFMSEEWIDCFVHLVRETERLGMEITLGIGPGWTGSGGPWVKGEESMQHLVASQVEVSGGNAQIIQLPVPEPRAPYFGYGTLDGIPGLHESWAGYYQDVAVLAFPTPTGNARIEDVDEKALYLRAPYTSMVNVRPWFPAVADYALLESGQAVDKNKIVDLTAMLQPDGSLTWDVPEGQWTVMRFGSRNNGAVTRPAPVPGIGLESDKFDTVAVRKHLDRFIGSLLERTGLPDARKKSGLRLLHMDSWEMGAQNWTARFRQEFIARRGYDPMPFYPVYLGYVVDNMEVSERFLWDLRQTSQELIIENHAEYVKRYAHEHNLRLSMQHYDMNPTSDMVLGSVADVPSCEFWTRGYGFNSSWGVIQAASVAHIGGRNVLTAEAFTAYLDAWSQYPGSMKNQGDWAFAAGVNRFIYHTYQHQPLADSLRPGMTMGPYGIHHDRGQTWWPMADEYHRYVARCQYLLQQGQPVADVLYLIPEGSPHVFTAPRSALTSLEDLDALGKSVFYGPGPEVKPMMPDRKGFNFSASTPDQLMKARVENGQVVFPGGARFKLLVLPARETMRPALLEKIASLIEAGATIVGNPPRKSPSLADMGQGDLQVAALSETIWGDLQVPAQMERVIHGAGSVIWGGAASKTAPDELYPHYDVTAGLLREAGNQEDFSASQALRYTHRQSNGFDIYFVSNRTDSPVTDLCTFRSVKGAPELWDPMTGETRPLPDFSTENGLTSIPMRFEPYQSYFVVFSADNGPSVPKGLNFASQERVKTIEGPWTVAFDTSLGGPSEITFDQLTDWTQHQNPGIKYFSGIAVYRKTLTWENAENGDGERLFLDLGKVNHLARVKLNGQNLGVAWTAPWRVELTGKLNQGENLLEIEVANLWPNRLIGDEFLPYDGIVRDQYPEWLLNGTSRTSGRHTFTTWQHFTKESPLVSSGLLGPVTIVSEKQTVQ